MAMVATFDSRRPTTRWRHSTPDSRLPNVGRRRAVGRRMSNVVFLAVAFLAVQVFADDAVSSAFTFDARYTPSGITPDARLFGE